MQGCKNGTSDDTHCQIHGCLLPGKSHYRWLLWHEGADSWVQSYMVCGDIREAARYTVLASASADAENRTEVEESCLDTVLAA